MFVGFCKKMEMQDINPRSLGKLSHTLPFDLHPLLIYIYIFLTLILITKSHHS